MILIGSRAVVHWHHHEPPESADWDVVCNYEEAAYFLGQEVSMSAASWWHDGVELHNDRFFYNDEIEKRYASEELAYIKGLRTVVTVCSSRGLAAIKRSHLYRPLNFAKHIKQYQLLDRNFTPDDLTFIERRNAFTKSIYPDRVGSKDQDNAAFFKDAVRREFAHDDLHGACGLTFYKTLKTDQTFANYDPDLWAALSDGERFRAIREEAYVIALERFLIPYRLKGENYSYRIAWLKAIEKCCTTLDNGPFREYAIDNWQELNTFDANIFDSFFRTELWKNRQPC